MFFLCFPKIKVLLKCSVLDLTFRGLHLGVIHSQTDAVRNLAQVILALPGEDLLNMRNDLYQVYYKLALYLIIRAARCLACNSHAHLVSKDGSVISRKSPSAAFRWSRRLLTSYKISRSQSHAILSANCVACQWTTALCINCRSIWKQLMEIYG